MINTPICPYCGGVGQLRSGESVLPGKGVTSLWVCENYPKCDSYVRCHEGGDKPMGTLASRSLRRLRKRAHDLFDPIWQECSSTLGRTAAYECAGRVMGVQGEFHIGFLDEIGCQTFIRKINLISDEMDNRIQAHERNMSCEADDWTIEILRSIFNPDDHTFYKKVSLKHIEIYEIVMQDALRCGLLILTDGDALLSPKGDHVVFGL